MRSLGPEVLLGAYWVQYPDNARADASKRADEFLARLDATCPGWRARDAFILQVDCEIWNGNSATAPNRAQIKAFCDRLVARTGGKYRPIVYAPKWAYGDTLAGLGYPLWASSYVSTVGGFQAIYPGDGSSRWGAYSGQTPAILQYSSSATIGGQTTCDANAYRGTLGQLKSLVTPAQEADVDLNDRVGDSEWTGRSVGDFFRDGFPVLGVLRGDWKDTEKLKDAPIGRMMQVIMSLPERDAADAARDAAMLAALNALSGQGVDMDELVDKMADAVVAKLPADRDDVTAEELAEAIRLAVRGPSRQ